MLVQDELRRTGFGDMLAAGVVLTGGSCKIEGLLDLAEELFHMPVRLGMPRPVSGLSEVVKNPIYATGVGLLMFGQMNQASQHQESMTNQGMKGVWERMKSWFQGSF